MTDEELQSICQEIVNLVFEKVGGEGSQKNANIATVMVNLAISCCVPNMRPELREDFMESIVDGFYNAFEVYDAKIQSDLEEENG